MFKGHKWVPGGLWTCVDCVVYHIFDKWAMFNPNIYETANLAHCVRLLLVTSVIIFVGLCRSIKHIGYH